MKLFKTLPLIVFAMLTVGCEAPDIKSNGTQVGPIGFSSDKPSFETERVNADTQTLEEYIVSYDDDYIYLYRYNPNLGIYMPYSLEDLDFQNEVSRYPIISEFRNRLRAEILISHQDTIDGVLTHEDRVIEIAIDLENLELSTKEGIQVFETSNYIMVDAYQEELADYTPLEPIN
jgi:hypothetical protein